MTRSFVTNVLFGPSSSLPEEQLFNLLQYQIFLRQYLWTDILSCARRSTRRIEMFNGCLQWVLRSQLCENAENDSVRTIHSDPSGEITSSFSRLAVYGAIKSLVRPSGRNHNSRPSDLDLAPAEIVYEGSGKNKTS